MIIPTLRKTCVPPPFMQFVPCIRDLKRVRLPRLPVSFRRLGACFGGSGFLGRLGPNPSLPYSEKARARTGRKGH